MFQPTHLERNKLTDQIEKLRRLTQPFFLPLDHNNGLQFIWLLVSLLFCVGGIVLVSLTGAIQFLENIQPSLTNNFLGGVVGTITQIWNSWLGWLFISLFLIGSFSFFNLRHQLRNKRWIHWLLLGGIVFMLLAVNGINAGIGFIARDLTNALVEKQQDGFYKILGVYALCFIVALPIIVSRFFLVLKLDIIWREWLSKSLISQYLTNRAYYQLNPNDEQETDVDNPDQRISEDTKTFTEQSLEFTVGVFDAILTFSLNIVILLTISKTLTFSLFTFAAIASSLLIYAGRKLVKINFDQLRYEADFRFGLVHIRNNAESIAFYAGEYPEKVENQRRLGSVVENFNLLIVWKAIIYTMRRSTNYAGVFFPYLIMAIPYFAGEIDYGRFIQANFAFNMVESSLFFIVNRIDRLAEFTAGVGRLEGFQSKVESISKETTADKDILNNNYSSILIKNTDLFAPGDNQLIIKDLSINVEQSDSILVVGPSGCGKTSLLRMISGLWKPNNGEVKRPKTGDLLFIPQKPYLILGSLREQLCYPTSVTKFSDDQLFSVLSEVNLDSFIDRYPDLNIKQDWTRILSLGEQQRLAFARLLLNSPQFAILDEATSALDINTERNLYELLKKRELAIISVGHRPTLIDFHENVLELTGKGNWRLTSNNSFKSENQKNL
mgnify:CR=1 FL=1|tara:strand:- start:32205 stop:34202 length:1998 start_codon:yes stop_codon:yes gene_type:complete